MKKNILRISFIFFMRLAQVSRQTDRVVAMLLLQLDYGIGFDNIFAFCVQASESDHQTHCVPFGPLDIRQKIPKYR